MILSILGANGPYPAKGGACSGYLLSSDSGQTRVLLDLGGGALGRLASETEIEKLNCAVLTHLHYDHMSDMLPMQYMLSFAGCPPLKLICPETPAKTFALLSNGPFDTYPVKDTTVGEMKLEFLPAAHPVEAYCVRVMCDGQMFVYTGDTNETPALTLFCDQADLLLADAGLSEDDWSRKAPHLSARRCGLLAKEARVKSLILTHLNPRYAPEALLEEAREFFPDARIARAGIRSNV